MRDFLFSDIAAIHGLSNVPDDPDLAIRTGTRLCEDLLEPLQDCFGRIAIRSAYRSCEVVQLGNDMQRAGRAGYNSASNAANYAGHIWDRRTEEGLAGAMACIVIPRVWDAFPEEGGWTRLAWWIHDHLPYCTLHFFPTYWAFNIGWSERPLRRIDSYAAPAGCLTREGMANHAGRDDALWHGIERAMLEPVAA